MEKEEVLSTKFFEEFPREILVHHKKFYPSIGFERPVRPVEILTTPPGVHIRGIKTINYVPVIH